MAALREQVWGRRINHRTDRIGYPPLVARSCTWTRGIQARWMSRAIVFVVVALVVVFDAQLLQAFVVPNNPSGSRRGLGDRRLVGRTAINKCEGQDAIAEAVAATKEGGGSPNVLVLSYSTSWCGPCKYMDPQVEKMSETFAGKANFIKIIGDKDKDGKTLMRLGSVRSVPQYHIYKDGEKVFVVKGANAEDLEKGLQEHTS